jgi:competence protein ComEC
MQGLNTHKSSQSTENTHLVWVYICGFNIAILTGILLAVSKPILGHRRSAWFVLIGIALYTVLVGADAAVARAAIMGGLFVIADRLLGRPLAALAYQAGHHGTRYSSSPAF